MVVPVTVEPAADNTKGTAAPALAPVTIRQQYTWLAVYFALNMALMLYNNAVMGKVLPLPACPCARIDLA